MSVVAGGIQPGDVLAERFRIRRRLGAGGTATVFLAEDCVLCRDVAIKRLHPEGSEADIRRFRREARLGAALVHPNLVTVFDTLSSSDGVLIVMEYVRGRPLSDLIHSDGMDARRLLEILRPAAAALDHAHQHGVVHRDVKPANVLIAESRVVKLVDLGTATAGHMTQITAENEVMGTLAYIAPERLAGESVGEPASDVYSLAVLAFEALTGNPPYRSDTPGELLHRVLHDPLPDINDASPGAPPRLGRVLAQGMDSDPDRRQASAGALVRDLEAAVADGSNGAVAQIHKPTAPMRAPRHEGPPLPPRVFDTPRSQRRRRLLQVLACVATLGLLAAGTWLAVANVGGGSDKGTGGGGKAATQRRGAAARSSATATPAASAAPSSQSTTTPSSSTTTTAPQASAIPSGDTATGAGTGAQLNDQGYGLIQQGRYAAAVPVLRRAVRAFPGGTSDINFAYALFNLGHALRMAGHPDEAIPILERRLRIPDQTQTVQAELAAARAEAGQ
jgi:eukaryotic-like serine/threonine-protein kinase